MKSKLPTIVCFAIIMLASSCGNPIEKDAEKAASVACQLQTLVKSTRFEDSIEERAKLESEAKKLELELKEKYATKESWGLFMAQYAAALNKCSSASFNNKKKAKAGKK